MPSRPGPTIAASMWAVTGPLAMSPLRTLPSSNVTLCEGMFDHRRRRSTGPWWAAPPGALLAMRTPMAPAASALPALIAKAQVPRSMSAMRPATSLVIAVQPSPGTPSAS